MVARKCKELKFVNYIIMNGERIRMDDLSDEERIDVAIKLNDKAMKSLGYTRTDDKTA